jgi:hypothetical protein
MPNLDYTFAANPFGVTTPPLDYTNVHANTTKTTHGIAIAFNGKVCGRLQGWNTGGAKKRGHKQVFELNNRSFGRPVDTIPGIAQGYTIQATAMEMWGKEVEFIMGSTVRYTDLINQTAPFTADEFWHKGINLYETVSYLGCWLIDMDHSDYRGGEGADATYTTNVSFAYTARILTRHSV